MLWSRQISNTKTLKTRDEHIRILPFVWQVIKKVIAFERIFFSVCREGWKSFMCLWQKYFIIVQFSIVFWKRKKHFPDFTSFQPFPSLIPTWKFTDFVLYSWIEKEWWWIAENNISFVMFKVSMLEFFSCIRCMKECFTGKVKLKLLGEVVELKLYIIWKRMKVLSEIHLRFESWKCL